MQPTIIDQQATLRLALEQIEREVLDGLRHGFFRLEVSCEIVTGQKRRLLICAGKSHVFTILEGDLPQ